LKKKLRRVSWELKKAITSASDLSQPPVGGKGKVKGDGGHGRKILIAVNTRE